MREGDLKFTLAGEKLQGSWVLVRMRHDRDRQFATWLAEPVRESRRGLADRQLRALAAILRTATVAG